MQWFIGFIVDCKSWLEDFYGETIFHCTFCPFELNIELMLVFINLILCAIIKMVLLMKQNAKKLVMEELWVTLSQSNDFTFIFIINVKYTEIINIIHLMIMIKMLLGFNSQPLFNPFTWFMLKGKRRNFVEKRQIKMKFISCNKDCCCCCFWTFNIQCHWLRLLRWWWWKLSRLSTNLVHYQCHYGVKPFYP